MKMCINMRQKLNIVVVQSHQVACHHFIISLEFSSLFTQVSQVALTLLNIMSLTDNKLLLDL